MKYFTLMIISIFSLVNLPGQSYDYESAWKKVAQLSNERKPKSALELLDQIAENAESENRKDQQLKIFAAKPHFTQQINERQSTRHLQDLINGVEQFDFPERSIAHLVVYQSLKSYYQNYSYLINTRTKIGDSIPNDINEWSKDDYKETLQGHLQKAISQPESLVVPIKEFDAILAEYNFKGKQARPYLLDVVYHYIIEDWGKSTFILEQDLLEIDWSTFLVPLRTFLQQDLEDISGLHPLHLYRTLLNIHDERGDELATVKVDLDRLQYLYHQLNDPEIIDKYLSLLAETRVAYSDQDQINQVDLHTAQFYYKQSHREEKQYYKKLAHEIATTLISTDTSLHQAALLIQQIEQPYLEAKAKRVYAHKESILFDIETSNLPIVQYSLVKIDDDPQFFIRKNQRDIKSYLDGLKVLQSGARSVKTDENFGRVATTAQLVNPGFGNYAIIISAGQAHHYVLFTVSDLAYVAHQKRELELYVTDRMGGNPLEGVTVRYYMQYYDRNTRSNSRKLLAEKHTDNKGYVKYKPAKLDGSVMVQLIHNEDALFLEDNYYIHNYPRRNKDRDGNVFILTDRSIYRPGQTVHFKAILVDYKKDVPVLGKARSVKIQLVDANGEEVQSLSLIPNDFGSVASTFTLPSSGLTGNFHINAILPGYYGNQYIQVEEYRRPTFQVEIEDTKGALQLDREVVVDGVANMFSGVGVSGASVKYRIYRHEKRWWWYYRGGGEDKILVNSGSSETNNQGEFSFSFIPLGTNNKNYIFTIETDVTDVNGETQSSSKEIATPSTPYTIQMDQKSIYDANDMDSLSFKVLNNAGEDVPVEVSYEIIELVDPGYLMEVKSAYNRWGYTVDETSQILSKWSKKSVISSGTLGNNKRKIPFKSLSAGGYQLIIKSGDTELEKYVAVTDRIEKRYPFVKALFVHMDKSSYQPGEKPTLTLGTPFNELSVLFSGENRGGLTDQEWITVSGQEKTTIQVRDDDLGGKGLNFWTIKNNRYYEEQLLLSVPWNHKKLDIDLITFRDRLLPGSEESWSIKISGEGTDGWAAELCAALYDRSLDQFLPHSWERSFYPSFYRSGRWQAAGFFWQTGRHTDYRWNVLPSIKSNQYIYPMLDLFYGGYSTIMMRSRKEMSSPMMQSEADGVIVEESIESTADQSANSLPPNASEPPPARDRTNLIDQVSIRKNLEETVFFYPQLTSDKDGNVQLNFTMGEALTSWKLLLFAHDTEWRYGFTEKEIITQKDLMIFPYPPRFLRQGDEIMIGGKVNNLTDTEISAQVEIHLKDAISGEEVTSLFIHQDQETTVSIELNGSSSFQFAIDVPEDYLHPIEYTFVAMGGDHSDGEQGFLPILTNKIYVTETRAITLASGDRKMISIAELMKGKEAISLQYDYTAHPVWTVLQALPYLAEYPHESTDQILNKYFANALGSKIMSSIPQLPQILEAWAKENNGDALKSALEKNEEYKSASLDHTPWVRAAKNESAQKRSLVQFLDRNALNYQKRKLLDKLVNMQNSDGGFPWFNGGRSNTYITQYLLEQLGKMIDLDILSIEDGQVSTVLNKAHKFALEELIDRYNKLKDKAEQGKLKLEDNHITGLDIGYLYSRMLHSDRIETPFTLAEKYFLNQSYKFWADQSDHLRALIAQIAFAEKEEAIVHNIMMSFDERMLIHEELGAYWKSSGRYGWYQTPIETQASLIETYQKVRPDHEKIPMMQLWLLNHKRTNAWPTTKSTTQAIHSILNKEEKLTAWTADKTKIPVLINGTASKVEGASASGYQKQNWYGKEINEVKEIAFQNNNSSVSWGGVYVSYLSPIDQVEFDGDGKISIQKEIYKRDIKGGKDVITSIDQGVEVGDILKIRMVIKADRSMSFVHLKDMRASGVEPKDVVSRHYYAGGLGYYQSTKDQSSHFFIDYLPQGTFVLEYELVVSHAGKMEAGIATLQSMYAPEFSSHSGSSSLYVQ